MEIAMAGGQLREIERLGRSLRGIPIHTGARYRLSYSFDATSERGCAGGVAFPGSLDDLARLLREAGRRGIPVFMRGAGSGFSGGAIPLDGGLVVSTEKMHRVLRFDARAGEVEVESGIVNRELQDYLEREGCFYPPDPASLNFSTIGGNIAENAGGPRAFKYGVTRRYVRSLTWLTAEGEIVLGAFPEGLTAGLVGAEGTLGAVYSARLRVLPLPEDFRTSLLEVRAGEEAFSFALSLLTAGLNPSVLEYIDAKTMRCVGEYCCFGGLGRDSDFLFIEIDGSRVEAAAQEALLGQMARAFGVVLRAARSAAERELLWKLRRSVSPSLARRGLTKVNEDVSLPLGALEEASRFVHALAGELDLDCYLFAHAGDGNMHVNIMTDRRRAEEMARVETFVERLFERVIGLGGTLSGEHGIGLTKSHYLSMVFTAAELELARGIKKAMDPRLILNPGKYFMPEAAACGGSVQRCSSIG
ncbi:MAG: FAD-linked oxidase C-terminal domain-containing protein [Candidatus Krumholzibacteria bacterium]|nr:FAD-linked oxidase C-terminal domain-containing protein [Candidatus Krumholzibacteria bacterium]